MDGGHSMRGVQTDHNTIIQALKLKQFKEAEKLSIALIKQNPLDSQAWVFLGETLYYQGYKKSSNQVFQRAWLLDPEARWVDGVFNRIKLMEDDLPRIDIEMLLDIPPISLSAAMIVKNEERCIKRCLDSIVNAVDEIIVLDTGSTDRTMDIVQSYPKVKLYQYEWKDDFGDARNESLKYVTSDWAICVDADEWLFEDDLHNIRKVASIYNISVPALLRIGRYHSIQSNIRIDYNEERILPMNRGIRFWGKVHPQVGGPRSMYEGEYVRPNVLVRFHHDGYEPKVFEANGKSELRLRALEAMLQAEPQNPSWLFFLGRELCAVGETDHALEFLERAEAFAGEQKGFGGILHIEMLMANIYMIKADLDLTRRYCQKVLKRVPDFPDALYLLSQVEIEQARKLAERARSCFILSKESFHSFRAPIEVDQEIPRRADAALEEVARILG
jgi:glycosyltransferase involved in cell wall biosynthesis